MRTPAGTECKFFYANYFRGRNQQECRLIAANRQFRTIDLEADYAEQWFLGLTPREALRKAGILSEGFWLKDFLENFCKPT